METQNIFIPAPLSGTTQTNCTLCESLVDTTPFIIPTPFVVCGEDCQILCHACATAAIAAHENWTTGARALSVIIVHCRTKRPPNHFDEPYLEVTDNCFICLEFKPLAKTSPCGHHQASCLECLKQWLTEVTALPNCPFCRELVQKVSGGQLSDRGEYSTLVVMYLDTEQDEFQREHDIDFERDGEDTGGEDGWYSWAGFQDNSDSGDSSDKYFDGSSVAEFNDNSHAQGWTMNDSGCRDFSYDSENHLKRTEKEVYRDLR